MASRSYMYCTRCYGKFQFACTSYGACMASYVRMLYRTVHGVYKSSVYTRLDPMACWTAMRVVRIVHLTYEVLRDLSVCVYSVCSLYGVVCLGAV